MAAMVPHPQHRRINQSANMLGDCYMLWCQEWGTIVADINHLDHEASMAIVGLL
jgi:hypothetical protein